MSEISWENQSSDPPEEELPESERLDTQTGGEGAALEKAQSEDEAAPIEGEESPEEEVPTWLSELGDEALQVQSAAEAVSEEHLVEWDLEIDEPEQQGEVKSTPAGDVPEWLTELSDEAIREHMGVEDDLPVEDFHKPSQEAGDFEQQVEAEEEGEEVAPKPVEDTPAWLAELKEEALRTPSKPKPPEAEAPPAEKIPEWLQEAEDTETQTQAEAPANEAEISLAEEIPDWLIELRSKSVQIETEVVSEEEIDASSRELSGWLQYSERIESESELDVEGGEGGVEASEAGSEPGEELPKWLRDFEDVRPGAETDVEIGEREAESSGELPVWLRDFEDVRPGVEAETDLSQAETEPGEELPAWLQQAGSVELGEEAGTEIGAEETEDAEQLPAWLRGELPDSESDITVDETEALSARKIPARSLDEGPDPLVEVRRALIDEEQSLPQEEKRPGVVKRVTGWFTGSDRPETQPSGELVEGEAAEIEIESVYESSIEEPPTITDEMLDELLVDRLGQSAEELLHEQEIPPDLEMVAYDSLVDEEIEVEPEEYEVEPEEYEVEPGEIEAEEVDFGIGEELLPQSAVDWEVETEQEHVELAEAESEIEESFGEAEAEIVQADLPPEEKSKWKAFLALLLWWRRDKPQEPALSDQDIERRLQVGLQEGQAVSEDTVAEDESSLRLADQAESDFELVDFFPPEAQVLEIPHQEDVEFAPPADKEPEAPETYDEETQLLDLYEYETEEDRIRIEQEAAALFLAGDVAQDLSEDYLQEAADRLPYEGATKEFEVEGFPVRDLGDEGYQDIREVALEGYVEPLILPPGEQQLPLRERIQAWLNGLSPAQKTLLIGLVLLDIALILSGFVFVAYSFFSLFAPPAPAPTVTPPMNLPYPVGIKLPGGWPFELHRGTVNNGIWAPEGAEWLEGTEIRRWIALPWNKQVEAVLRSLESGDEVELVMSNGDRLLYKVQSFEKVPVTQLRELNSNVPSLLLILANEDAETRWVIIAELAE